MFDNKDWEIGVSASDFHIPFHDKKTLELLKKFLNDIQPNYFVINGDFVDFWEISKFDKTPRAGKTLKDEIEEARVILKDIREILPETKIIFLEGNHCFRLKKYLISNAKELYGLDGLTVEEQLGLKDLKIDYVGCAEGMSRFGHNSWKIGHLHIGHFDSVSTKAGYTANWLIENLGVSVIQGHTHRFGASSKSYMDGRTLIGIEQGCMCDLNPTYISHPNWQQGFTVFFKKKDKNRFQACPVIITEYKFFWGNKEYAL